MKKIFIVVTFVLCFTLMLNAESLEDKLRYFNLEDATSFLQPLANSMGAGMNSGLYNTAEVLKPFRPSFRFGGTFAIIPSSDKTFLAHSPYGEIVETATIFGTDVGKFTQGAEEILLPKGADLSLVPVPQMMLALGLPFGNEVMFRGWFETKLSGEIGDMGFWGVGLKHSIDQYLPAIFPLDLSLVGFYQKMNVADFINLESYSVNIAASIKVLMLTIYGGAGYEQANLEAKYVYSFPYSPDPPLVTTLDFKGKNDFSGMLGARMTVFPLVSVFADFTYAHTSTINFGVGVGF